jgi:hypothetical protein
MKRPSRVRTVASWAASRVNQRMASAPCSSSKSMRDSSKRRSSSWLRSSSHSECAPMRSPSRPLSSTRTRSPSASVWLRLKGCQLLCVVPKDGALKLGHPSHTRRRVSVVAVAAVVEVSTTGQAQQQAEQHQQGLQPEPAAQRKGYGVGHGGLQHPLLLGVKGGNAPAGVLLTQPRNGS